MSSVSSEKPTQPHAESAPADGEWAPYALDRDAVLERLEVQPEQGLSSDQAAQRREQYGPNQLRRTKRRSVWRILLNQFESIVILLLLAAAVAAFATARWPEGIALVAVTVVNAGIGFFSEWKAIRSMESLRRLGDLQVRVRRDGQEQQLDDIELVPGDIVLLSGEDLVPADLRLVTAEQLRVNEAALTGESVPANKTVDSQEEQTPLAERVCMLYKGTSVAEGEAVGVVVATGMATELGHISALAEAAEGTTTPLQQRLDRLGRRLAWITIGVAIVVAIAGLISGRETVLMIETAIALGVAAIPEGLPIVATIALARGMYLMAQRSAVVNRLTAVETLGATRVIFSDKTGTLTENRMTVRKLVTPDGEYDVEEDETADAELADDPSALRVIRLGVLCNNATVGDQQQDQTGDPTEVALLQAGRDLDISRDQLLQEYPERREESFDPDVMMMATFHEGPEGIWVAVKGAPEAVIEVCQRVGDDEGELSEEDRNEWLQRADELAAAGLRLLAVADKQVSSTEVEPYSELSWRGLIGLVDPPRRDIRDAIERCQHAGIRAIMVTGDRPDTGQAIGEQVGLADDGEAIHGSELTALDELSDPERQRLLQASVFARVTPEQKLHLVELYQQQGEIVAMTGDGVNDAPALKQADIGVAMGKRGTDAAKQVADMVLLDDEFGSIVAAVEQGRIIFANIRKSVIFMLCTNLAEILAVTVASLAQLPIPLRPLQILYLNVLTDVLPALALGVGKGSGDVMNHPPRDPEEAVLTRHHWLAIGGWSVVIGSCVLVALLLALRWLGFGDLQAITISFLTLGFSKLWFVLNLRGRGAHLFRNDVVRNPWIGAALVVCIALLLLAVYWPFLANVLQTEPPTVRGWWLIIGMSLIPALAGLFVPGIRFHTTTSRTAEHNGGAGPATAEE